MITVRSASVRNLALSGKSWTIQKDKSPPTIVVKPANIKIHSQPCFPRTPSIFEIAAFGGAKSVEILRKIETLLTASKAPKAPDIEAAEKKIAERKPNSERLYQLNSDESEVYGNSDCGIP